MKKAFSTILVIIVLSSVMMVSGGCSGEDQSDPRGVVISMFGAMERNDAAALAHLLDLTELMKDTGEHHALKGGKPRLFTNPQELLDDLINEGETKRRWFSFQRIINKSKIVGETASVEVTFVDKAASKGYMTRFGLKMQNGKWRIHTFQTIQEPKSE